MQTVKVILNFLYIILDRCDEYKIVVLRCYWWYRRKAFGKLLIIYLFWTILSSRECKRRFLLNKRFFQKTLLIWHNDRCTFFCIVMEDANFTWFSVLILSDGQYHDCGFYIRASLTGGFHGYDSRLWHPPCRRGKRQKFAMLKQKTVENQIQNKADAQTWNNYHK